MKTYSHIAQKAASTTSHTTQDLSTSTNARTSMPRHKAASTGMPTSASIVKFWLLTLIYALRVGLGRRCRPWVWGSGAHSPLKDTGRGADSLSRSLRPLLRDVWGVSLHLTPRPLLVLGPANFPYLRFSEVRVFVCSCACT